MKFKLPKPIITIIGHVRYFLKKNNKDNISALAGQSAFFMILSVVPFIMFLIAISVLLFGESKQPDVGVNNVITQTLTKIISYLYDSFSQSSNAAIISAVIALWSAGKGIYIITDGILRIYRLPIKGVWLLRRIYAMGYTIAMMLIFLISIIFLLLNSALEMIITDSVKDLPGVTYALYSLRYVLITLVLSVAMTFALKLFLLRKIDDRRYCKFRVLFPGMLFTNIAWMLLSFGMNIYMQYFGSSSLYGQLGAVIYAMIWVYFSMYLLLCGIQINYIYRKRFYDFRLRNLFKRKNKNAGTKQS